MSKQWQLLELEKVSRVVDSLHKTPEFTDSGYPMVRAADVKGGFLDLVETKLVSQEDFLDFTRNHKPQQSDIVLSRVGSYFNFSYNKSGKEFCIGQNTSIIVPEIESRFLYYSLISPFVQDQVERSLVGTSQRTLSLKYIRELKIPVPSISEQRAIAGILGALDDKIELNRRMNATLESIARAVFHQWFVKNEEVMGWEIANLGLFLKDIISGSRPKGGAHAEGIPSIGAENINGLGQYDYSKEKYVPEDFFLELKAKGANVQPGDVLLYKDGAHIGRKTYFDCGFPHETCSINEHVFILRSKNNFGQKYLFFWLDQDWMTQKIINLNSNSAQPGINKTAVSQLKILLAPEKVIQEFNDLITPITDKIFANCKESRTLASLRDSLLPKLMRGEVRVSAL